MELGSAFSQSKDELVLGFFEGEDEFYIRALLSGQITLLSFPEQFPRAKKNSTDLFQELIGFKVIDVIQYDMERSFSLLFENGMKLLFKMHGNRSNIALISNDKVTKLFNNKLENDKNILEDDLDRNLSYDFDSFASNDFNLARTCPTLGRKIVAYIYDQVGKEASPSVVWKEVEQVMEEIEEPKFFIAYDQEKPYLSLLSKVPDVRETFNEAVSVANRYYYLLTKEYFLLAEKGKRIKFLENKIKKGQRYLSKTKGKLNELVSARPEDELANIIMANLHSISDSSSEVTLDDLYLGGTVKIKLKKNLTPQKNAESLYKKAKNKKIELDVLGKNILNKEKELEYLGNELKQVRESNSIKELRKENKKNSEKDDMLKPYISFETMGYAILVGRNAKHNDTLTLKVAKKNDLWLHAKDAAGSHVVIKEKPGHGFPQVVIETAAQLAAYYSKRRTDSFCPVIYTPKKYVRKVKGSKPGAVMVDKEKVVIVKPEKVL